jgi:hypothetical protein
MLHQTINQVVKQQKKLLIITSSFLLFSFCSYSQILSKQDSISFKNELEKLLTKYGLQTAGYQINVQSKDQRGGQTAFSINNNYVTYNVGIVPRKLSDQDKINLITRIDKMILDNKQSKKILIKIGYISGNVENQSFANDVGYFLLSKGYNVDKSLASTWGADDLGFKLIFSETYIVIHVGTALNNDRP